MKKMTIALLTAAAMGTSGFAVAQSGPDVSGRVNIDIQNLEGDETEFTTGNADRLQVSDTTELAGGLTGDYFLRLEHQRTGGDDGDEVRATRARFGISGDFGRVSVGRDDDIVYKFVGVRTDVPYGNIATAPDAAASSATTDGDDVSLQYQTSVAGFTVGAYVDTALTDVDGDGDADTEDGFNNTQLGAQFDFGMGSAGVVYSDTENAGANSELAFGVTLNLSPVTLAITARDDADDNNPVSVFGSIPVTDLVTGYGAYGDPDNANDAEFLLGASLNLGGGFVTYGEYVSGGAGDNEDQSGFVLGGQYSF